ncbi:MAG: heavy metal translocating P-type ATPase [Legionella sp.]
MPRTYLFSLPDIRCVNCVQPIENLLQAYCKQIEQRNGISCQFAIDLLHKELRIELATDEIQASNVLQALLQELDDIGVAYIAKDNSQLQDNDVTHHWWRGFIGSAVGLALMALSLLNIQLTVPLQLIVAGVSTLLTLYLGIESYREAFSAWFKTRTLTMDSLFSMSTFSVLLVSIASFFFSWLPRMFEAGLLIFGFRHLGLAIQESLKKSMGYRAKFTDRVANRVNVWENNRFVSRLLSDVRVGDILEIAGGEVIPVDGLCVVDEALVFETIVTGSIMPRRFVDGDAMLAGMYLPPDAPPLHLQCTAIAGESNLARLDKQIARANFEKAPLETATNQIMQYFVPAVIVFAALSAIIVGQYYPLAVAIQCAVSVLVSACPCTLGFITPLGVRIGMNKATEHGVQFISAKQLQEAEQIDCVVFDLNGTLTRGEPKVRTHEVLLPEISEKQFKAYVASLEKNSRHPVAKAIVSFANLQDEDYLEMSSVNDDFYAGLSATIDDQFFALGNHDFMRQRGVDTASVDLSLQTAAGDSVIYLARNQQLVGYLVLNDPLRNDAQQTIHALQAQGKEVYICTGADYRTAQRYSQMLGVDDHHLAAAYSGSAEGMHKHKKDFITQLKQQGKRVAMVGDGGNDALAMSVSDLGIAITSPGADSVTQTQAGAILANQSLFPVSHLFVIAKQTVSNIKLNLKLSLIYNTLAMLVSGGLLLTLGVILSPGVGVALMALQSSLLLYNAYRFKQEPIPALTIAGDMVQPSSYQLMQSTLSRRLSRAEPIVTERFEERPRTLVLDNLSAEQEPSNLDIINYGVR